MSETNIENNMISEEDLEKAAGGLKINKSTLKKALLATGALAIAGVGGYYICKNGSKKESGQKLPYLDTGTELDTIVNGSGFCDIHK